MEEILKSVLGDAVSDTVVTQLHETVTRALADGTATAVAAALQEQKLAHDAEIAKLTESAEQYGQMLVEQHTGVVTKLTEKANAYEAQLKGENTDNQLVSVLQESMAKLNEKHLNEITALNEQAQEYAGYVKQQLTEKASQYVTKFVEEYQTLHEKEFSKLAEHNRMLGLFENFRAVISAHGYDLDDDMKYQALQEQVSQLTESKKIADEKVVELSKLQESLAFQVEKEKYLRENANGLSENEIANIVSLTEKLHPKTISDFDVLFTTLKEKSSGVSTSTQTQDVRKLHENVKAQQPSVNKTVTTNNEWA